MKRLGFESRFVRLEPLSIEHTDALLRAATRDRSTFGLAPVPRDRAEMTDYIAAALADEQANRALPFAVFGNPQRVPEPSALAPAGGARLRSSELAEPSALAPAGGARLRSGELAEPSALAPAGGARLSSGELAEPSALAPAGGARLSSGELAEPSALAPAGGARLRSGELAEPSALAPAGGARLRSGEVAEVVGSIRLMSLEWWSWPAGPISTPGEPRRAGAGEPPDVAELGHAWLVPSAQRTAVFTTTALLLATHAFETWRVHRLVLKTDARNARSRAAIERLGGRFEGILRSHLPAADGIIRDTAMFSIVRDEWAGVRIRLESALGGPL